MTIVFSDLSRFGRRELDMAVNLLSKYAELSSYSDLLGSNVKVMFDADNGNVFLADDDLNIAKFNGESLERWYMCPNCGDNGFTDEFKHIDGDYDNLYCYCCSAVISK